MKDGFDLIHAAYEVPGLDEHERAVLVRLAVMARDGKAWPSIAHLIEKTGKSERTIQRAIRRLVAAGHIEQRQRRHDSAVYTVHPVSGDPKPVSVTGVAETGVGATGVTDAVKTRPTDTLIAKNNQPSTKTTSSPKKRVRVTAAFELPDWVPLDPWNAWLDMRRIKGGRDTAYALNLAIGELRKLADAGHPPGDVLDQSTLSRWTKLYPIKEPRHELSPRVDHARSQPVSARGNRPDPALDLRRVALAELEAEARAGEDQAPDRGPWLALSAGGGG